MTTTKLSQIIAVEASVKTRTDKAVTAVYHAIQRTEPLTGLSRTYQPKKEDGETFPPEHKRVQATGEQVVEQFREAFAGLFDLTATKDFANCHAKADVVVDGVVILKDAPVTYLLFLEKKLVDVHTFILKLPTLDPGETWHVDEAQNCWASDVSYSTKSRKEMKNHEKSPATDKHPAQVEVYTEDVVIGTWTIRKFSGALPVARVAEFTKRVDKLLSAVKFAREQANTVQAPELRVADALLGYVFNK
jgi:hypothetical protein